jgi:DNA modification methylase
MTEKISDQMALPINYQIRYYTKPDQIAHLLEEDLDFRQQESGYASHQIHSFPAKFPPQLPRKFIEVLTLPGEVVLDPMQGSGTSLLEAALTGRKAIGFDIDPLAILISKVKTTSLDPDRTLASGRDVIQKAKDRLTKKPEALESALQIRWGLETRQFIDQWFMHQTQLELLALILEIELLVDENIRDFLELAFSAIIITKSGGVSLALDLAHTRPHRAKVVLSKSGQILVGQDNAGEESPRSRHTTKILRSTFDEFEKRLRLNVKGLIDNPVYDYQPRAAMGNAQALPLPGNYADLIVTSPPYASNAIDYMRAHKFSLVWLGYPIQQLSHKRNEYIGGESAVDFQFEQMPDFTNQIVSEIAKLDPQKGRTLHRYYSEMKRVLREMYRVLKPGKTSIVVVGTSIMRGRDTETQNCLVEIGKEAGFTVPEIGVRNLDRDKRMMPAGSKIDLGSQIQQRMHQEYVIAFYKPILRNVE